MPARATLRGMTMRQAANRLRVPYNTIKYRVEHGLLRHRATPFGPLIEEEEVEAYRAERRRRGLR